MLFTYAPRCGLLPIRYPFEKRLKNPPLQGPIGHSSLERASHFIRRPGIDSISLEVKKVEKLLQQDKDFFKRVEIMEMDLKEKSKKKYFITIA